MVEDLIEHGVRCQAEFNKGHITEAPYFYVIVQDTTISGKVAKQLSSHEDLFKVGDYEEEGCISHMAFYYKAD